jgi:hypothetical protein
MAELYEPRAPKGRSGEYGNQQALTPGLSGAGS